MSKKFLSGINVTGTATLNTVADAGSNTDKFLVLDSSNNVSYRTAAELYADLGIGVTPAAYTSTLKHEVKASQTISKGQAVYVSSADGTNMIVSKASNVSEQYSSKTMGLLETSLVTNGKGNVITEGLLSGLNTNGANAGDPVWLGVDGALIFGLANKPVAPAHLVFIGIVTRANSNNGEIFVKVQNGFEMNELHNYLEGSVQNNQVIVYESATSLYKPKAISTILGYTPADDSLVVKLAGTQTITGTKIFNADIRLNKTDGTGGVLNIKRGTFTGGINDFTSVFSEGDELSIVSQTSTSVRYAKFSLSGLTSGSIRTYTLPNADGTLALISDIPSLSGYVPTSRTITINGTSYDLSADRSWTISANLNARTEYEFTTDGTTATYSAVYSVGQVDVFYNGSKLASTEFTATNGTSVTLGFTPPTGQAVEVVAWETGGGVASGRTLTINGTTYDLSANRSWTVTDSSKLPLSGGTLTGSLGIGISPENTYQGLTIYGSNPSLRLKGTGTGSWNWIEFVTSAGVNNFSMGVSQSTPIFVIKAGAGLDGPNFAMNSIGNVGIGTAAPISGGSGAKWLTTDGSGSTYGGGLVSSLNGSAKAYYYFDGSYAQVQGASGVGIQFTTNGVTAATTITSAGSVLINRTTNPYESTYKFIVKNTTDQNIGFGLQGGQLSIEAFNDAINSPRPLRIYSSGLSLIGGNVTIGVAGSNTGLSVIGTGTILVLGESGGTPKQLLIGIDGGTGTSEIQSVWQGNSYTRLSLNPVAGSVYAGGVRLDTLSDERVKDNIQPITGALNKVLSITGKKFHLKDEEEGKLRYGFIAQELEGIIDEFVIQTKNTFKKGDLEVENVKSIDNWASSWSALLVEAMKEQQAQIEELKARLNN